MEPSIANTSDNADLHSKKLGEIPINREAFDLDLKINEGYQNYSGELLRLALLTLAGLSAVWLRIYLPDGSHPKVLPLANRMSFIFAFSVTSVAAGAALVHRYTAADSLAYHLTSLRRRARNRPAGGTSPSDAELAEKQDRARDKRFKWSGMLLRLSMGSLFLGLILFCSSLAGLMF